MIRPIISNSVIATQPITKAKSQTQTQHNPSLRDSFRRGALNGIATGLSHLPGGLKALGAIAAFSFVEGCAQKPITSTNPFKDWEKQPFPTPMPTSTPSATPKPIQTPIPTPTPKVRPTPLPQATPVPVTFKPDNPLGSEKPFYTRDVMYARSFDGKMKDLSSSDRELLMQVWEVIEKASSQSGSFGAEAKAMRRLLESGHIKIKKDSAELLADTPITTSGTKIAASYNLESNTITVPDTWSTKTLQDRASLIHELKHAVDDFRILTYGLDRSEDEKIEGGDRLDWPFEDPFSGIKGKIDYREWITNSQRAVDTEFSAFITETQYMLTEAGIDPLDPFYAEDLNELAAKLDKIGLFKDDKGKFDGNLFDGTMELMCYYYNIPRGIYDVKLNGKDLEFGTAYYNLTQMVESRYFPFNFPRFANGGRDSVNKGKRPFSTASVHAPQMPHLSFDSLRRSLGAEK